ITESATSEKFQLRNESLNRSKIENNSKDNEENIKNIFLKPRKESKFPFSPFSSLSAFTTKMIYTPVSDTNSNTNTLTNPSINFPSYQLGDRELSRNN